jgi:hypothetical protein
MAVSLVSTGVTFPDNSTQTTAATGFGFKNRLINGSMVIDQRNAGASVTPTDGQYTLDRWQAFQAVAGKYTVQQNAPSLGSVTPPVGYTNYLGCTSASAYTVGSSEYFFVSQSLEGFNTADLAWGTANAAAVTLSFWVRSSLTGTFGGVIKQFSNTRSYPFTYTISSANTWEQKSITITGDTSGTYATGNTGSIRLIFSLGAGSTLSGTAGSWSGASYTSATGATSVVGTSGATFYITGVQLEKGSTATSFDYRPYTTELQLCQRYYYRIVSEASFGRFGIANNLSTTIATAIVQYPVKMRAIPTALEQSGTAADYTILGTSIFTCSSVPVIGTSGTNTTYGTVNFTASGLTAGQVSQCSSSSGVSTAYLGWSAEL